MKSLSSNVKFSDQAAGKAFVLAFVIITAMVLLLLRLTWLQVIQNKYYKTAAEDNSTRVTFLRAPRGSLYDRHGNLLATNKQSLSMIAVPNQLDNIQGLATRIAKILDLEYAEVFDRLMKAKASSSVLPIVIEHDLNLEHVSKFYEQKIFLPGIDILPDISRTYPHAEVTAHVLGYCGEITKPQLLRRPDRKMGDVVGQAGIEKVYDDQLRGVDGEQRVRVNAMGQSSSPETAKPIITKKAVPGQPIVLSLDLNLQRCAYQALGEKSGAIVAMDPQSGEILALVSRPSYDPNVFTRRLTKEDRKLLSHPSHPLHNRALSGFPPGSIWKPITMLAALDYKVIKPGDKIHVSGGVSLGGFTFHDWTSASGLFDLVKCMQWSRDSAFYIMALKMTPEMIKKWGNMLGAGRPTGVELPNERSGTVPDSEWKLRRMHEKWYPGNTLHMSIGQTFIQLTPVQGARIYAGLAMKGRVPFSHLAIKIGDRQIPAPKAEYWKIKPEYMKVISDGLRAVVQGGTAGRVNMPEVAISGKTGSAEAPPKGSKTHGWFCCYAPSEKPEIVVCAFVEHGGHGGAVAAPLAKVVLQEYFGIKKTPLPGVSDAKPKKPAAKPRH